MLIGSAIVAKSRILSREICPKDKFPEDPDEYGEIIAENFPIAYESG